MRRNQNKKRKQINEHDGYSELFIGGSEDNFADHTQTQHAEGNRNRRKFNTGSELLPPDADSPTT